MLDSTWKLVSCVIDGETVYKDKELMEKLRRRKQNSFSSPEASTEANTTTLATASKVGVSTQRTVAVVERVDPLALVSNHALWPKEVVLTSPVSFTTHCGETVL